MTTITDPSDDRGLVIEIERTFPATIEAVFRRWTDADALARWFAPPGYVTVHAESDPRPGGAWRLDFRADAGRHEYTEQGTYREVDPFENLTLTLTQVDGGSSNSQTLVTVLLRDIGTSENPRTLMRFIQSGYRASGLRNANEEGWHGCFASLARDLETHAAT